MAKPVDQSQNFYLTLIFIINLFRSRNNDRSVSSQGLDQESVLLYKYYNMYALGNIPCNSGVIPNCNMTHESRPPPQ